jgi:hypothetical protein
MRRTALVCGCSEAVTNRDEPAPGTPHPNCARALLHDQQHEPRFPPNGVIDTERNWGLKLLTGRSRDNLPNPPMSAANPYMPENMPAIGDLFDFDQD